MITKLLVIIVKIIELEDLTKYYGDTKGTESLSFEVKKGEIFGFLGPNGAGKTTTIRTLLGFLKPTRGRARIFGEEVGENVVELKQDIGYIPGDLNLYESMTGKEFLNYFESLRYSSSPMLENLLKIFNLPLDKKIEGYSGGMKQKLGIIQAFMHDPKLVIMDEPTSGLDPLVQKKFYDFLKEEKEKGRTMFFSSHILSEVEKVCDRAGIIRNGELVTLEKVEKLREKRGKIVKAKIKESIEEFDGPEDMEIEDGWIRFVATDDIDKWVKKLSNYSVIDLEIKKFGLEDVFMHYYEEDRER